MKPEECASKLGITVEELFARAYKLHGLVLSPGGEKSDLAWYKKWGSVPLYVTKFVKREERRASAPVIDA